jgi:hypothetical protein
MRLALERLKVKQLTGFGEPSTSTRHIRQLPATDSLSW